MDDIREQLDRPLWVGIISFIVGLLIGLVVLGWWLWPGCRDGQRTHRRSW
jgi:hypothetical protein